MAEGCQKKQVRPKSEDSKMKKVRSPKKREAKKKSNTIKGKNTARCGRGEKKFKKGSTEKKI